MGCLAAPPGRGWFDPVRYGYGHVRGHRRRFFRDVSVHAPNIGVAAASNSLNGLAQIAQQMPPVTHLNRIWRPLTDAARVGTGTIAGDNLDPGMLTQPPSGAVSLSIRQQVDHRVAFQIDKNGSTPVAPAPGPAISRRNARNRWLASLTGGFAHQPQQRVGTGRHGQPFGRARTGPTAQRRAGMTLELARPLGPLCKRPGGTGQGPGKGLSRAGRIETAKATRLHARRHGLTLPG